MTAIIPTGRIDGQFLTNGGNSQLDAEGKPVFTAAPFLIRLTSVDDDGLTYVGTGADSAILDLQPFSFTLDENGFLITGDGQTPGAWVPVGRYRVVIKRIAGDTETDIPNFIPFEINVTAAHTLTAPLELAAEYPYDQGSDASPLSAADIATIKTFLETGATGTGGEVDTTELTTAVTAAKAARDEAVTAKTTALTAKTQAQTAAGNAAASVASAAAASAAAGTARDDAVTAKSAAETAQHAAEQAQGAAEAAATSAGQNGGGGGSGGPDAATLAARDDAVAALNAAQAARDAARQARDAAVVAQHAAEAAGGAGGGSGIYDSDLNFTSQVMTSDDGRDITIIADAFGGDSSATFTPGHLDGLFCDYGDGETAKQPHLIRDGGGNRIFANGKTGDENETLFKHTYTKNGTYEPFLIARYIAGPMTGEEVTTNLGTIYVNSDANTPDLQPSLQFYAQSYNGPRTYSFNTSAYPYNGSSSDPTLSSPTFEFSHLDAQGNLVVDSTFTPYLMPGQQPSTSAYTSFTFPENTTGVPITYTTKVTWSYASGGKAGQSASQTVQIVIN